MHRFKARNATQLTITLLLLLLLLSVISSSTAVEAFQSLGGTRASLYPNPATLETYRITLVCNISGNYYPRSHWYDPEGHEISQGGGVTREYEYLYGSVIKTTDYFYIAGRDLLPGLYRVSQDACINQNFRILDPIKYIYIPLIMR